MQFLPEGHMRHTWITLALDAGMSVNDVAYLSGNSPNIIYKHYASKSRVTHVPEF
jgi:integrase